MKLKATRSTDLPVQSNQPPEAPAGASARRLMRSAVYRQVPADVRTRLDRELLLAPLNRSWLEELRARLELGERYQVSAAALRSYARRLEQLVRPVVLSQVVAAVFGCLPEADRHDEAGGRQVLLLSRMVNALNANGRQPVADLARMGTVLAGASRRHAGGNPTAPTTGEHSSPETPDPDVDDALARAVRAVYGLDWPPPPSQPEPTPG